MKSVISEIFDGEGNRAENVARSDKYRQMQKKAQTAYEQFINTLNKEQVIMFEEVLDNLFTLNEELTTVDLEEGFKQGLLVAFEAFGK